MDYACSSGDYSGDWGLGQRSFVDPVPAGNQVTHVSATLYGVLQCIDSLNPFLINTTTLLLSGTAIETIGITGNCACGNCQSHNFSAASPAGWVGYSYGGSNTVSIVAGDLCVDRIEVEITWEPTDNDGDGYEFPLDCDDTDATIHPGAQEACDGIDND
ncbi:MAG TPA: hypothetical protein DIU15_11915, partial [Deltaproteobacteria bacterium]|nr:hypothetical protein [Deltaproteobacteria bacterium]